MFQSLKRRDLCQQCSSTIAYRQGGWREDVDAVWIRGIDARACCAKEGKLPSNLSRLNLHVSSD